MCWIWKVCIFRWRWMNICRGAAFAFGPLGRLDCEMLWQVGKINGVVFRRIAFVNMLHLHRWCYNFLQQISRTSGWFGFIKYCKESHRVGFRFHLEMFFLQRKVKYVGNEVSQNGIEVDPDKIKVKSWSTLTTFEQPSQFLCYAEYCRKLLKVSPQ